MADQKRSDAQKRRWARYRKAKKVPEANVEAPVASGLRFDAKRLSDMAKDVSDKAEAFEKAKLELKKALG